MNLRSTAFAAALIALLGATSAAQAEDYHAHIAPTVSAHSRSAVQQQAVEAAHAANQNIPAAAVPLGALASSRDRMQVHADAVLAAHAPDQNVSASSRVNSTVISTLPHPVAAQVQQAGGERPRTN